MFSNIYHVEVWDNTGSYSVFDFQTESNAMECFYAMKDAVNIESIRYVKPRNTVRDEDD